MAVKIDLEKSYNKLIKARLFHINLPPNLIDIIMSCISSVSTAILFDGGAMKPIIPSRGFRHGDPLSLYLFILCMDCLGELIESKCAEKLWTLVKSSKIGSSFSHMFFVDDLVLFAKVNQVNCSTIKDVLDEFYKKFGQSVNEANQGSISPQMKTEILESPFVIFLGSNLLIFLVST